MEIGSRQLHEALAHYYGLQPTQRVAFRGRLEHLRKLGCPAGITGGRGRPAKFGWDQAVELLVALELVNLGLSPNMTAEFLSRQRVGLMAGAGALAQSSFVEFAQALELGRWPFEITIILEAEVNALGAMTHRGDNDSQVLVYMSGPRLVETLENAQQASSRIILDLGSILLRFVVAVSEQVSKAPADLAADFMVWGRSNGGS